MFKELSNDMGFSVAVLGFTPNPQSVIYCGLHQCYNHEWVDTLPSDKSEKTCGEIAVKSLLEGGKGHYSPLELASITFSIKGINTGTLNQLTRHRHLSPCVQSHRYTVEQYMDNVDVDELIYIRKVGMYRDREGNKSEYTQQMRMEDWGIASSLIQHYKRRILQGIPPEVARGLLPFDYRSNLILAGNVRTFLHLFDLRLKKDAQSEIVELSSLFWNQLKVYIPEITEWYEKNRLGKAILSP
jgi:thymidylate synthase (FAD)